MRALVFRCLSWLSLVGLAAVAHAEPATHGLGHLPVDPAIVKAKTRYLPEKARRARLDWRELGAVTSAKNQAECGSCWAFAVTGCVESHIIIDAGGPAMDLSEQYLVSCAGGYGDCCGGNYLAFEFLQASELKVEESLPYGNGDSGPSGCAPNYVPCPAEIPGVADYGIMAWWAIPQDDGQLIANLQSGPFYVAFDVYQDFMDYWNGETPATYSHAYGNYMGSHAVLLIGYDDGEGCWIIKNSWGDTGGPFHDGTARIAYNGHCNFAVAAATCTVGSGGTFAGLADAKYAHVLTSTAAGGDSVYLMGGPGRQDGKFQDDGGTIPDGEGWLKFSTPLSVGDFAKVWPYLSDRDPCAYDNSPQVAFIDDGEVVPGTGGSPGITWVYGPSGYVVNSQGGLAGPTAHLHNEIWSPVLSWPSGNRDGCLYSFNVYCHLPLRAGIYYHWAVRSSADGGYSWSPWYDRGFNYYDDTAEYLRVRNDVTDLLLPYRTHIQVALGVAECGWIWGFESSDVTPAPYFDNVQIVARAAAGPAITARDVELFQGSNFPAIGVIDYSDLGANSVRLDMARNISPRGHLRNDPGDSLVVDVTADRAGAVLNGPPLMHCRLFRNPLFDPYRTSGLGKADLQAVEMSSSQGPDKSLANRWYGDLPDTGFFFPGDVLHYYIETSDTWGAVTRLPADTTGFSYDPGMAGYVPLRYPSLFCVRALPSLRSGTFGDQPHMLFWNDAPESGDEEEWTNSLSQLGFREGSDYDLYYTNGASLGAGNGLGGRATAAQLSGYSCILYTSGDISHYTLSNGDYNADASNDIGVMDAWLRQGYKRWLCTGDDLENDLHFSGATAVNFRNTWLSVTHNANDVRPLISNQTSPTVRPVMGNTVGLTEDYVVFGGCRHLNAFDAVTASGAAELIAQYLSLSGTPVWPYAAAVFNYVPECYAGVVYLPYDLAFIYTPYAAKDFARQSTRTRMLQSILLFFGFAGSSPASSVVPELAFSATSYPNPFNPKTTIEYTVPQTGEVSIKIYNVRGELVKSLIKERVERPAVCKAVWDGTNDAGQVVASGVYFYRVQAGDNVAFRKMTLVR